MQAVLSNRISRIFSAILVFTLIASLALSSLGTRALAPAWQPGVFYAVGALASYNNVDYKAIQAHTSQVGWEPPNTPALWTAQAGSTTVPATATRTNTTAAATATRTNTTVGATATRTSTTTTSTNVKVNFQPATAPTVAGYLVDGGAVYAARGNGQTYGWNVDNAGFARDRNATNSPDQLYDTLNHMQKGAGSLWEIGLPNGTYSVRIVGGDPSNYDTTFNITA
jgi:hypothetical protein